MGGKSIIVEGVSKKYVIGHQSHTSISDRVKSLWTKSEGTREDFWALKDVSFEINQGEAVGIIGKNGSGKSTLLKILSRITHPTEGRFEMNGRVSSLLEVGTGFHPELSGRENIFLNGTILGMTRREIKARFDEIVAFSGVEKFIDTPVKHYSSGMYVRLAFAVAAHLEPEILIIDEVLAVGDAEFQKKCLGKMGEVTREGRTVLFVSHNMNAINNLCLKGLVLGSGRNLFFGSVSGAIEHYGSLSIDDYTIEEGEWEFLIKSIRMVDPISSIEIESPVCGYPVQIQISGEMGSTVGDIECGISIYDKNGSFITVLNNKMSNYNFDLDANEVLISCTLNDFPLMAGYYFCSLTIKANNKKVYSSTKAFVFQIVASDYYNSGYQNTYGRQGIFLQQTWQYEIKKN